MHPNRAGGIEADNTFTDNDEQFVRVSFGNNDAVTDTQTWLRLEVPYRVTVRTSVRAPLTIEAGTVLEYAQDVSIIVADEGSLNAVGTADALRNGGWKPRSPECVDRQYRWFRAHSRQRGRAHVRERE